MSVFLLFQQIYDCCDFHETLIGVFSSEFAAELEKESREKENTDWALTYFIREWEVEGEKVKEIS